MSVFVLCGACAWPHEGAPGTCERCGVVGWWRATLNTNGLTLDQLRRFAHSARATANRRAVIARRWVASFHLYTITLDDPTAQVSVEVLGLFWVRLHGVIAELPEYLAGGYFAGTTEQQARAHPDPDVVRYAAAHANATAATRAIGESLSRDQHIYADWRRHTECHLRQSAYDVQLHSHRSGDRSLKGQSSIKGLADQGPISVEELNTAIRRVLAAHRGDDLTVARALADQIKPAAAQLDAAWADFP